MLRLIPRLDIKGPNLVKGVQLEGLRVLGDPALFSKIYDEQGADELIYMDVVASLYGRNSTLDMIKKTAGEVFIPITVGGGLRTLQDIKEALRSGADKVAINTAALSDPEFIRRASKMFGSSTIVVSIEVLSRQGVYECFTNNGRDRTGVHPLTWAKRAQELGAGEILLTSIEHEGCGSGLDKTLVSQMNQMLEIPLVVSGGIGHVQHVTDVAREKCLQGVGIASMFHYDVLAQLGMSKTWAKVSPCSIPALKQQLHRDGVEVRL